MYSAYDRTSRLIIVVILVHMSNILDSFTCGTRPISVFVAIDASYFG